MQLDRSNLEEYARGCAILGSGGGGDVHIGLLQALSVVEEHGPVRVVDPDVLADDALVMPVGGWGAPTVSIEKFESGEEGDVLRREVERWFGRPVAALMAEEIGGGNGVLPVSWAGRMGLPIVDADGMGRAFPEGPQVSMHLAGVSAAPAFFADEHGNVVTVDPIDGSWYERLARAITVAFGGNVGGADHVMDAATVRIATVRGSVTRALAIGRAIASGGVEALARSAGAIRLVSGKVVDVDRRTTGGFARGTVDVEGTGDDGGRGVRIHVQNENLLAIEGDRVLASVPDLITLVDEATGDAVPTELVRYGHRVVVMGFPCDPIWRTADGLRVGGPAAFGFSHDYVPIGELHLRG